MFEGVVKGVVAPHFGFETTVDEDEEEQGAKKSESGWNGDWKVGDERFGWGCFGKGEVRGGW